MVNRWMGLMIVFSFLSLLTYMIAPGLAPYRSNRVSVEDVLKAGNQRTGKLVVQGNVKAKSIYHEPKDRTLRFLIISEKGKELKVVYNGQAPKGLRGGARVTIEGRFTVEQVFLAESIWTVDKKEDHFDEGER